MWQKGLLLRTQEGEVVVEACYEKEQQKITISVLPKLSDNYLIQKIREELAKIADEGKLRSREGASENPSEKFGLAGLSPIFEGKENPILQKILDLIDKAEIAEVFEALDGLNIRNHQLNQLRQEFIHGNVGYNFYERLRMAVREALREN
jgi:hypothetical protein